MTSLLLSTSTSRLPNTLRGPMYFLLVATHSILASESSETDLTLGADRRIHGALGPGLMLGPNMTVLLLLIRSIVPTTALLGTASVSGSVFPEKNVEHYGSPVGQENISPHLVGVRFLMVTTLPCAKHASFGTSSDGEGFGGKRRNHSCRSSRHRIIHSLNGVSCA